MDLGSVSLFPVKINYLNLYSRYAQLNESNINIALDCNYDVLILGRNKLKSYKFEMDIIGGNGLHQLVSDFYKSSPIQDHMNVIKSMSGVLSCLRNATNIYPILVGF